jgi:hypothetical protein
MIITSSTAISIDVDAQNKGNLFALTDVIDSNLGQCDTIFGVKLKTAFPGAKVKGSSVCDIDDVVQAMPKMKQRLEITDHKGEKFVLEYCTQTGHYEIVENEFDTTELTTLELEVLRFDANRRIKAAA